jgi:hypothetical protein
MSLLKVKGGKLSIHHSSDIRSRGQNVIGESSGCDGRTGLSLLIVQGLNCH